MTNVDCSYDQVDRLCPHFRECGGCDIQDVAYSEQLARKEAYLHRLFHDYWRDPIQVLPSPIIRHYRNKVDLNFALKQYPTPPPRDYPRETVLGFKRKGRWYWTLDIRECAIAPEGVGELVCAVREWARERKLPAFSSKTQQGLLRVLLVREGKRTGGRMVVLITSPGTFDTESFVETVFRSYPPTSIQHAVFSGQAEIAAADAIEVLHGPEYIEEQLIIPDEDGVRTLRFRLSPFSFFQTNTLAAERLYGLVRRWVKTIRAQTLLDLYGGSGGIAIACADLARQVVSVESVAAAGEDGCFNARANDVNNVAFLTRRVEDYLRDIRRDELPMTDVAAVIDPPRAGMHPKALQRLVELRPPHVLYVSCHPAQFQKELPVLLPYYHLCAMQAVDMFPHTQHVELVAYLVSRSFQGRPSEHSHANA